MIEINLLPGAGKKNRNRGGSSMNFGALASNTMARIRDPYMIAAVIGATLSLVAVFGMYKYQGSQMRSVDASLQTAEQDSIRFAAIIKEKRKAESQRDSVLTQLTLIRSIDGKRFVWPHIMDEVSRALPQYTWITQVTQTNSADPATAAQPTAPASDTSKKKGTSPQALSDSLEAADRTSFRVVGNTVDIQALTRFMKMLEASPFIENVQLVKSAMIIAEGKEITEFQLDAAYQKPDSSEIRTVPVTLSVR
ncbi:MAG: PilN domain-containing protein [Gemmatimonadaceae bacterium]